MKELEIDLTKKEEKEINPLSLNVDFRNIMGGAVRMLCLMNQVSPEGLKLAEMQLWAELESWKGEKKLSIWERAKIKAAKWQKKSR